MYIVEKTTTGTVHIVDETKIFTTTLCGYLAESKVLNRHNYNFSTPLNYNDLKHRPEITCKKCLNIYNAKDI